MSVSATPDGFAFRLTARPDPIDFRDAMYEATLVEVPKRRPLSAYRAAGVPILDQGAEGACTGFGLATVAHYLLLSRRDIEDSDKIPVSPRMFYEMAKRYDEWPGADYSGSSARGAMKGWHKHGVCSEAAWPYTPAAEAVKGGNVLTAARAADAASRPLGAYYRVNHLDFVCLHSALAEVGALYATSQVHDGWRPENVQKDGSIPFMPDVIGGHAFAVVGYDEDGIWIQNSWGDGWGLGGFGRISYDDWLKNATDVWVARLGAPVRLTSPRATATTQWAPAQPSEGYTFQDIRPHIISLGNDGVLKTSGTYGTGPDDVAHIVEDEVRETLEGWGTKRLLLYAHGGLVPEQSMVQRVADYRTAMLDAEVYPLAFIWHTDFWTALTDTLKDAVRGIRPEGFLDSTKDFLLDRLDDAMEPIARGLTGKLVWDQMKQNAIAATEGDGGGALITLQHIRALKAAVPDMEIHLAGHSAGAIFLAPLAKALGEASIPISSLTLWAPACTLEVFRKYYLPLLDAHSIERFSLFTLTDRVERDDDCVNIYHKSLLYLVSDAFEATQRVPLLHPDGEPLLGMERYVRKDPDLRRLFGLDGNDPTRPRNGFEWILAPNPNPSGSPSASAARHHGDFDDDVPTLLATLARIVGAESEPSSLSVKRSAVSVAERRGQVDMLTRDRSKM
ncbi:MAG TPA: C1 family peptidase [Armatimonadota bacterium]|jgi:hypothetical protein